MCVCVGGAGVWEAFFKNLNAIALLGEGFF